MKRNLSALDRDVGQDWSRIIQEAFADGIDCDIKLSYGKKIKFETATPGTYVEAYEGNYTTWTIQSIYDTNAQENDYRNWMIGIRNNGNVILWSGSSKSTYIISSAGVLLVTLTGEDIPAGGWLGPLRIHSILDRYILFVHKDWTDPPSRIIVQEGIAELWTRNPALDSGEYTLDDEPLKIGRVAISPSGEWIVALVREKTTGNGLVFIYKGG